ncbi:MAG: histidine ammonia-lyase [Anaerolineales bacterium]|nr:histidine ammonia-lyase [Anaerolineales bacterium]
MIVIDGKSLSIQEIRQVAVKGEEISLSRESAAKIQQSRKWVEEIINRGDPVYGINTGFGIFADRQISSHESRLLNRNLILSHAVGTGDPLPREVVRAAMLIRVNTLAKGFSGVRLLLIETLLEMLNRGIHPVIPSQGSLGSSGDLAPLSHLALVLSTDEEDLDQLSGFAEYGGELTSGKEAMNKAGIPRIILEAKEGIALNNGATFSAAIAALACIDAENLLSIAEISLSMSLEALLSISSAFDPRIHESRQHPGQITVAERVRELTRGSSLLDSTNRVQDAYSLRCSPQVHGPARETLTFATGVISREINAATDNPLLFGEGEAISGGNFHGEPVGLVMDYLGIAMTEIAGIAERRVFRLTDGKLNENLPSMLVDQHENAGLNSGMMMPQYTAASLVLESRSLATPDSTYSLPTSAAQEDHNANSMTAARHTRQIIANTAHVLAIELYTAARALDIRIRDIPHTKLGIGTSAAFRCIRDVVPYQAGDALWGPEIDAVRELIITREISSAVEEAE